MKLTITKKDFKVIAYALDIIGWEPGGDEDTPMEIQARKTFCKIISSAGYELEPWRKSGVKPG